MKFSSIQGSSSPILSAKLVIEFTKVGCDIAKSSFGRVLRQEKEAYQRVVLPSDC